jgi:ribosomal protein L37AE/L43A
MLHLQVRAFIGGCSFWDIYIECPHCGYTMVRRVFYSDLWSNGYPKRCEECKKVVPNLSYLLGAVPESHILKARWHRNES